MKNHFGRKYPKCNTRGYLVEQRSNPVDRRQVSKIVEREKQIQDKYGEMVSTRPSANLNKIGVGIGIVLMILALLAFVSFSILLGGLLFLGGLISQSSDRSIAGKKKKNAYSSDQNVPVAVQSDTDTHERLITPPLT